jgi:hypothetical protein
MPGEVEHRIALGQIGTITNAAEASGVVCPSRVAARFEPTSVCASGSIGTMVRR